MKRFLILSAAAATLLASANTVQAAPITGGFSITGTTFLVSGGAVDQTYYIEFLEEAITGINGGYFAPMTTGDTLQVMPFTDVAGNPTIDTSTITGGNTTFTTIPTDTLVSVPGFLDNFSTPGLTGLEFELTLLPSSTANDCISTGGTGPCTPAVDGQSPFTLSQGTTGIDVSFGVFGIFTNGADIGFGQGTFTTQFTSLEEGIFCFESEFCQPAGEGEVPTIAEILAVLSTGGSILANSFSATFSSQAAPIVPEPATLLTFGLGASALAALRRRRRQKNSAVVPSSTVPS